MNMFKLAIIVENNGKESTEWVFTDNIILNEDGKLEFSSKIMDSKYLYKSKDVFEHTEQLNSEISNENFIDLRHMEVVFIKTKFLKIKLNKTSDN